MADLSGPTPQADEARDLIEHIKKIEAYTHELTSFISKQSAAFDKLTKNFADHYTKDGVASPTASVNTRMQRALATPRAQGGSGMPNSSSWDEAEAVSSGQPSPTASVGAKSWLDRVTQSGSGSSLMLPHLQGAVLTPADQLNFLASTAANIANNKRSTVQKELIALNARQADPNQPFTEVDADRQNALLTQLNEGNLGGGFASKASNAFGTMAAGYAQGRYVSASLKTIFDPIAGARNLGYETGYQGAQPGFLGIRMPWDGGAAAGAGQHLASLGFAFNNSLTPPQANTIFSNLFSNGWLGGTQTNQMRDAAAQIMRTNPYVGSQPATYTMMDQATRMGVTSLQAFVDTMRGVPDAALAAHTSIAQTMSDMQAVGSIVQQQGSTVQQGYNLNNDWQNITGLPGAVLAPALSNPMVQATTYMNTGLMPMEQGLAGSGTRISSVMQTINRMFNTVQPQAAKTIRGPGGFSQNISRDQQRFALMAQFFPGWDSSTLSKLYHNQTAINAGSNIQTELNDWQQMANGASQHGNTAQLNALLGSSAKGGDWGAILRGIQQAKYIGASGNVRQMFSAKQIQGIKDIRQHDINHWITKPYAYDSQNPDIGNIQKVFHNIQAARLEHGQGKLPAQLAKQILHDTKWQTQKDMGANTQKQSNPGATTVSIKLQGAAAKLFSLSSPQAQGKSQAGAGQININQAAASGLSAPPMPDFNTSYGSVQPPSEMTDNWGQDGG